MIRETIAKLAEGACVSRDEAQLVMSEIMSGEATPAQIASYITALRIRGETPDVIAGSADAMRRKFTAVATPEAAGVVVDTCGTGGDGACTFNISTTTAFVVAGAGILVAKHGNRSISSKCGSADVLAALGVKIDVPPEIMSECLKEFGIAFLFAPTLHPAMKFAIAPRREIGIRSIFNILGPLSNPARAQYGVLGVYHPDLTDTLGKAASALGSRHLFVVHGLDGLDELSISAPSKVTEVRGENVRSYELDPRSLGFTLAEQKDLVGGDPAENAAITRAILAGQAGPRRDVVLLNSAAAIVAGQLASDLPSALALARRSIDSGAALNKLDRLVEATQRSS